jgi:hypothetical protein
MYFPRGVFTLSSSRAKYTGASAPVTTNKNISMCEVLMKKIATDQEESNILRGKATIHKTN